MRIQPLIEKYAEMKPISVEYKIQPTNNFTIIKIIGFTVETD